MMIKSLKANYQRTHPQKSLQLMKKMNLLVLSPIINKKRGRGTLRAGTECILNLPDHTMVLKGKLSMIIIRNAQKKALAIPALSLYRKNLEAHLIKHFKEQCDKLGKEGVSDAIGHAFEHAEKYNITSGKELCLYVNLMFTFGRNFDNDKELTWARPFFEESGYFATPGTLKKLYRYALDNIMDKKAYAS